MLTQYFTRAATIEKRRRGMAGPYLDDFIQWLESRGYHRSTIRLHIREAVNFTLWAHTQSLTLRELDQIALTQFGEQLARRSALRAPSGNFAYPSHSARLFVRFLVAIGIVTPRASQPSVSLPPFFQEFTEWMRTQRGAREVTLNRYRQPITALVERVGSDPTHWSVRALRQFVLSYAHEHSVIQAKNVVTAVRMFLRFLHACGYCPTDLAPAMPTIARWRLATLPKYLPGDQVEQLICSCDRATPLGLRDHAILLLLARLGLRANDVAGLKFADLHWPEGTLIVAGKNRRQARLPLPQEVGDAVLQYIDQARPPVTSDFVFMTTVAPWKPISHQVVGRVVVRALRRAGIQAPVRGARVLRHSAATSLLRQGVSLPTIGALLRHASLETTTIYAKVDVDLLQHVVMPWPEVCSC
jgi:site-specific recombinase XerD